MESVLRGILGLVVMVGLGYLLSSDRKRINWRLVISGVLMQLLLAVLVFKVGFVRSGLEWVAEGFAQITEFTKEGSAMLFPALLDTESFGFMFAFQVLPTIIFFSALTSVLYYYKVLQRLVYAFAWLMNKTMHLSGAESLSAAANIFVGQTEAPLVVKPYISKMTKSEILCLMAGGMATIAGGVLLSYIDLLGGMDDVRRTEVATHLLTASIMSAPAAIVIAKMLLPESEDIDRNMEIHTEEIGGNALESITNGTTDGLKLAVNVGAMLLVFTAFVAMINVLLSNVGGAVGLNNWIAANVPGYDSFSLQFIMGGIFAPIAWLIGVPVDDLMISGQLLGEKTILNEFYAYNTLGLIKDTGAIAHHKTMVILEFALCGFSNIASIGIQIGGISTIAPEQKGTLAKLGIKALIAGTIACLMTATIAGMFV